MKLAPVESLVSPEWEGAAIANVCGVPGSIGCLALTRHERSLVLVTTQHALLGAGAPQQAPVALMRRTGAEGNLKRIGSSGWGRRGTVRFGDADVYVDCAVVELDERGVVPRGWSVVEDETCVTRSPMLGERVTKTGAATGSTEGFIVDVDHSARALVDGRARAAPRQLLVRPRARGRAFSAAGDSGAVLRDQRGAIVGLLWGVTSGGESVACPIAPVLWVLHVQPVRLLPVKPLSPLDRVF
jgi:hypothetical protein